MPIAERDAGCCLRASIPRFAAFANLFYLGLGLPFDACHFVLSKLDKKLQRAEKDLARHGHFDRLERKLKWPFAGVPRRLVPAT